MRPLIGIVGEVTGGEKPELVLPLRYVDAVERAGGLALAIGPSTASATKASALELLTRLDGLVFSGADDFDVARLGLGPTHPSAKPVPACKQDFDLALARLALKDGVPVLGICYGMQLFALAEGGRLHQHLPDDRPGSQPHTGGVVHAVRVQRGTQLGSILGVEALPVVSRHHQGVAAFGPRWTACASDDEGLVEALERGHHPFALGVQWHPELSAQDTPHARLFTALVEAASERALERAADAVPRRSLAP